MNLEKRITKIAIDLHPFRDTGCMIKTMADRALQGKIGKALNKLIEGLRHEQAFDEIKRIEDLIKETR